MSYQLECMGTRFPCLFTNRIKGSNKVINKFLIFMHNSPNIFHQKQKKARVSFLPTDSKYFVSVQCWLFPTDAWHNPR